MDDRGRWFLVAWGCVPLLSVALPAGGQRLPALGDHVQIRWRAPDGCPDARHVRDKVLRTLGDSWERGQRVRADATASRQGALWRVDLHFERDGHASHRAVEAESCALAGDAAALVIALVIDPGLRLPALEPPAEPQARPVDVPATSRSNAGRDDPTPWGFRFAAGANSSLGALPSASFGLHARGATWHGRLQLAVWGAYVLPQTASAGANGTAQADIGLSFGGLSVCYGFIDSRLFDLAACLGSELGWMSGEGAGRVEGLSRGALWLASSGGLQGRWPLAERLGISTELDLIVPWRRPRFVVLEAGTAHQPDPLAVRLQMSFFLRVGS